MTTRTVTPRPRPRHRSSGTLVTIQELTGERRTWQHNARTTDTSVAVGRALRRHFGPAAGFHQDHGLLPGYGSVIRTLPNTGNGWSASVVIGRARLTVEE